MKSYYIVLLCLILSTFIFSAPASAYEYSLKVRTTYMQECFLDDPPDLKNQSKVYLKMKRCLCMLDKFEARYSEEQFLDLMDHENKMYSWQKRELDDFVKKSTKNCLQ